MKIFNLKKGGAVALMLFMTVCAYHAEHGGYNIL